MFDARRVEQQQGRSSSAYKHSKLHEVVTEDFLLPFDEEHHLRGDPHAFADEEVGLADAAAD